MSLRIREFWDFHLYVKVKVAALTSNHTANLFSVLYGQPHLPGSMCVVLCPPPSWTCAYICAIQWSGADPGFGIRGGVSRRGVWGLLKVPQRFQDRALVGGPGGWNPPPKLWGFEELHTFIWTTILNQPHHFYQTKKTLLLILILSDNC
jgi:hypothetical protein